MTRRPQATPDPYGHGITLTARGDGRLRVRWFDPPASRRSEHRRERTFTDPDAAREFAHELATGFSNHGDHALVRQARRTTPWAEVSQAWVDIKSANGDWSPPIAAQNQQLLTRWALPLLGPLPLPQIYRDDYERVLAAMTAANRPGSRQRIRSLLAQLELWAADSGYCDYRRFPVRTTTGSSQPTTAGTATGFVAAGLRPDPARVARLRQAVAEVGRPPRWWRALQLDISSISGLRLGETFALRSCHLDLDALTLDVRWQYVSYPGEPQHLKRPKGEKVRTTILLASMRPEMERRLAEVAGEHGPPCPDCTDSRCGLLFPSPRGGPHFSSAFGRQVARASFQATQADPNPELRWPKRADGQWQWTWHSLRHHAAVTLVDHLQLPVADAALLLGDTEKVFLDRYYGATAGALDRATAVAREH